jgi:hypothetical protein
MVQVVGEVQLSQVYKQGHAGVWVDLRNVFAGCTEGIGFVVSPFPNWEGFQSGRRIEPFTQVFFYLMLWLVSTNHERMMHLTRLYGNEKLLNTQPCI